jgi:hypothetical protein
MITFADLQATLDAIADNAISDVEGENCPHKRFWRINRQDFVSNEVPNIVIAGVTYHIKIVNSATPLESAFYKILLGDLTVNEGANSTTIPQMPENGPFITDASYTVSVNGVNKSGADIQKDIEGWLANGMP